MTCVAARRPAGRAVIGVGGLVVVCDVATGTDHGQSGVIVIHMAARAGNANVGAGERKRRVVVIKDALSPRNRVVADLASRGKTQLNVIDRCYSIVVVDLVASNTGRALQAVVVIDVAGRASHANVCTGQGKAGRGVVECCARPR